MADWLLRAQVSIPRVTGTPADAVVNTFHFDGDDSIDGVAAYTSAVMTKLTAFYQAIDTYLGSIVASPATVKIYNMRDAEPRAPIHEATIALTIPAGVDQLPGEVALCVSFQALRQSGQSQARRRGRIFLGPIGAGNSEETNGDVRPNATLLTQVALAADSLIQPIALPTSGDLRLAIYSPTTRDTGASLDDSFHDVHDGWVDNAFDIVRSRGAKPNSRTTFSN